MMTQAGSLSPPTPSAASPVLLSAAPSLYGAAQPAPEPSPFLLSPNSRRSHSYMPDADDDSSTANATIFRDCLSSLVIQRLAPAAPATKRRRRAKGRRGGGSEGGEVQRESIGSGDGDGGGDEGDAEGLGEFVEYLASDIFPALPPELRTLSYAATRADPALLARYEPPLPGETVDVLTRALLSVAAVDSLAAYGLLPSTDKGIEDVNPSFVAFLNALVPPYAIAAAAAPASALPFSARAAACEICERDWIPLTYHHLVPRSVHAKVVKRGWHEEWRLNSVSWLCRACHSFVHGIAGNEELAREWYTVELLRGREDVRRWGEWVGRVRWKAK